MADDTEDQSSLNESKWAEGKSEASIKTTPSPPEMAEKNVVPKFRRYLASADLLLQQITKPPSVPVITDENLCDSTHLLERNTDSFRCLAQVMLSSSSLSKNRLFLFPPLEDPGIALAFNYEDPAPVMDDIGAVRYQKLCRELKIVPITRIVDSLDSDTLDLKYYGLTSKDVEALSEAMKVNSHVQTLILDDNWLTPEMSQMMCDMIGENTSLLELSLRECRIGEEGAQKLGEALASIETLKSLDLSYNDLGDAGLLALKAGLCENASLIKLNLSHNNVGEASGEVIEAILLENTTIQELDLSWNGFYTQPGNKRLFNGLLKSDRIKSLNLSWNGIGIVPAVRPLTRYLKKAQCLEELDISNNRLSGGSLRITKTAINKNHSLRVVKIGNNIYGPEETQIMLNMFAGKTKDPLNYLDMENMYINKDAKPILTKIKNIGKSVKIGGILGDYKIHGPDAKKLIYERCRYILMKPKNPKARKDFGCFILSLPEQPISTEDFQKELKKQKIKKLDKDLVQALMNLFIAKKQQVDCPALMQNYKSYYPDARPPPPKPKKPKKGKKGKAKAEEEDEVTKVETLEETKEEGEEILQPVSSKKSLVEAETVKPQSDSKQSVNATSESQATDQKSEVTKTASITEESPTPTTEPPITEEN